MNRKQIIEKIIQKKEFSQLPLKDVELAFSHFDKERYVDEEKVKLTRDLLRKVFSAFASQKILSPKDKNPEWILRKHLSTRERMNVQRSSKDSQMRERLPYYDEIYGRILKDAGKKVTILDLGAGVNGFSYNYFRKLNINVDYVSIEAVGQLVDLMNHYFNAEKISGKAFHLSLFELEKIKELVLKQKKPRIIFLLKTLDSLEMMKRDYSKELLLNLVPLCEKMIVSFATRSMIKKKKFHAQRNWIVDFIKKNFEVLDDFEIGWERYIVFKK